MIFLSSRRLAISIYSQESACTVHRSAGQFRGQNVFRTLIVDDEPIARRVLRDELAVCSDIEIVAEAEDGVSAVRLIHQLTPDLIFLDLQMPRMSGFEVIQTVRSTTATIVVVTACNDGASSALHAGAAAYLPKPVNPTCLRAILARVRRQWELQGAARTYPPDLRRDSIGFGARYAKP
jgi:YesN/AraC family two-component response regulator